MIFDVQLVRVDKQIHGFLQLFKGCVQGKAGYVLRIASVYKERGLDMVGVERSCQLLPVGFGRSFRLSTQSPVFECFMPRGASHEVEVRVTRRWSTQDRGAEPRGMADRVFDDFRSVAESGNAHSFGID